MALLFKITDVGLAQAQNAIDMGIKIKLTTFKLGSSFGYVPNGTETALAGSVLYSDVITSYKNMPDGSLVLICSVDVQAGPFQFGEVGIYNEFGQLFALATLPQLQTKYTSLGSNVNSTFTFNCHMRLSQSTGIFEINGIDIPASEMYVQWKDVKAPVLMNDPRVNRIIISNPDSRGDLASLVQNSSGGWSIQSNLICVGPNVAITTTNVNYIDVTEAVWVKMFPGLRSVTVPASNNATLVVQMPNSTFRQAVATISAGNVRLTFSDPLATALLITDLVSVWCNDVPRVRGLRLTNSNLDLLVASGNGTYDDPLKYTVDLDAFNTALSGVGTPVGSLVLTAGNTAPAGTLKANGATVSRAAYPDLFAQIYKMSVCLISLGTPGVIGVTSFTPKPNDVMEFTSTGILPTGFLTGTQYYVVGASIIPGVSFQLSATPGGAAIATSGSPSGIHTIHNAPYGIGDGVTTFGIPDWRGEFFRGWDDGRGVDIDRSFGSFQADELKSHQHGAVTPSGLGQGAGGGVQYVVQGGVTGFTGGVETRPRNRALLACIKY